MVTESRRDDCDALARRGLRVVPMAPSLAGALVRFHESLTAQTIRSRFFGPHRHLSVDEVDHFCDVDHRDRDALAVLDDDGEIVAVARFDRLSSGSPIAEVAFVVADTWQHLGIGASLFGRLVERARALGIETFVADTLADNRAMRAVFRHAGYPIVETVTLGVAHIIIELPTS